jgi:hypothetical protein
VRRTFTVIAHLRCARIRRGLHLRDVVAHHRLGIVQRASTIPRGRLRTVLRDWGPRRLAGLASWRNHPPYRERPTSMISRFSKRLQNFSLIPAVCVTIFLGACGSAPISGMSPASPAAHGLTKKVPASVRVLVVTYVPETGSQPDSSESVTITDLTRVRKVSSLIHGLKQVPSGAAYSCPAHTEGTVNLTFKSSTSGGTLAAAKFNRSGCPAMDLTISGAQQYLNVSGAFASQVLQVAGIVSGMCCRRRPRRSRSRPTSMPGDTESACSPTTTFNTKDFAMSVASDHRTPVSV